MSDANALSPRTMPPTKKVADKAANIKNSGRVAFDARGNSVWEWKTEAGDYSCDINTARLRKLEASELSIEQTGKVKKIDGLALADDAMTDGGFNPYDHSSKKITPDDHQVRNAIPSIVAKPVLEPARKPVKDLKAYGEWLAMKKRLANQKDDE